MSGSQKGQQFDIIGKGAFRAVGHPAHDAAQHGVVRRHHANNERLHGVMIALTVRVRFGWGSGG